MTKEDQARQLLAAEPHDLLCPARTSCGYCRCHQRRALDAIAKALASQPPAAADLMERLRARYTPDEVPPCRVCGRALRIQRAGGGERTVWGCDGLEDDPDEPGRLRRAPDYDPANDHYGRSRWEQFRTGDSDVLALLAVLDPSPSPFVDCAGEDGR